MTECWLSAKSGLCQTMFDSQEKEAGGEGEPASESVFSQVELFKVTLAEARSRSNSGCLWLTGGDASRRMRFQLYRASNLLLGTVTKVNDDAENIQDFRESMP